MNDTTDVVARLRELHQPFGLYDECDCPSNEDGEIQHANPDAVVSCYDWDTCEPALWFVCAHCCIHPNGEGHLEHCADNHKHGPGQPICATTALLDAAAASP